MGIWLLTRTRDQLTLAKDILATTWESDNPNVDRERLALALERIALADELFSILCNEFAQLQGQYDKLRRTTEAVPVLGLQPRAGGKTLQGEPPVASLSKKGFSPDQGLIDSYHKLFFEHAELRRETKLLRANVESAIRHIEDFWQGDDSTKVFVIEKLRLALSAEIGSET